ncbi:hypothetical protein ACFY1L_55920 [Streptomyces sp. NPDC001663]|uniref:hypothetical protein n=1 Tax=Streptomyces sp. NPDC001663 TaxID=3364597 RepID=UPI00367E4ECF
MPGPSGNVGATTTASWWTHTTTGAPQSARRAKEAGVQYRDYDRFPGRDVVLAARRHNPDMLIIAVSYYARHERDVAA